MPMPQGFPSPPIPGQHPQPHAPFPLPQPVVANTMPSDVPKGPAALKDVDTSANVIEVVPSSSVTLKPGTLLVYGDNEVSPVSTALLFFSRFCVR